MTVDLFLMTQYAGQSDDVHSLLNKKHRIPRLSASLQLCSESIDQALGLGLECSHLQTINIDTQSLSYKPTTIDRSAIQTSSCS